MEQITVGCTVYWEDPDNGACSGNYVVDSIDGEIYNISNEVGSETQAYENELTLIKKP